MDKWRVNRDGDLLYNKRLVVPNLPELHEAILAEAHKSKFVTHPKSTKMYQDLKWKYWWNEMKKDVATLVAKCMTCQQVKAEHQKLTGL